MKQKSLKYEEIAPQFISILEQRGIKGKDAVMSFLYPRLDDLPLPQGMKDLTDATELIVKAIEDGRNIVVWGDYDVDGTTATSLLVMFFREIDIEVTWHIPDRVSEGYGLNLNYIRTIADNLHDSKFLLLTVDCGIANAVEISEVQSWGVDVIVTDHHQLQKNSMPSCITINPHQDNCGFSDSHLAGVGVAFYLVAGIRGRLQALGFFKNKFMPNLKALLAFVALGSVADMVPLRSTNRILVRAGMEALAGRQYPGLSALVTSAGLTDGRIFSEDIGFSLGPRINAAGRMGQSDLAVRVLTCTDNREAERLAKILSQMNDARKARCLSNLELALSFIDPVQIERDNCCILAGDFHLGTMGITASKLVERLHVPVIICSYVENNNQSEDRKILKGSCRSVEGIDIFKALDHCKDTLISFGGHALAAGVSIEADRLNHLRYQISCYIRQLGDESKTKRSTLRYDIEFPINLALKNSNTEIFSLMDPFGPDNKKPIFYDSKAIIIEARTLGQKKEHLQLTFRGSDASFKGIGFSLGEKIHRIREKGEYELLYTLSNNRYQDKQKWQPLILDIW